LLTGTAVAADTVAGAPPALAAARPTAEQGPTRTLTLVTGDRVTVSGAGGRVSAEAGPGRSGVTFEITTGGGQVRVLPSDAGPLLAAGRLDARLFDVTELLASGYDRQDQLPLIVTGGSGAMVAATRASVAGVDGLAKVRDLPAVGAVAVRQSRGKAAQSWQALTGGGATARGLRAGVGKVWLDGMRKPSLDVSVPQIGAPAAWEAGYTGAGSTVAVLDTGVDDTHPDLAGQVVGRQNFTDGVEPDSDLSGHGTHVASTIAGTGAASSGKYKGVAPGAKLLDGKVCVVEGCAESWIIAGMTWAAADEHAKVVNLSLGGEDDPNVVDPVEQAVQDLSTQYGTLFVIAAGNTDGGAVEGGISSPGTAEAALTVGAVNDADALADFSRRGPRAPDDGVKPEITAPGVNITAARGKDATSVPGNPGAPYTTLSGTSMATPHVAGAAAILAQRHGDWSGQQLKAALMGAAKPNPAYGVYAQGAGRVDVARAIGQRVTSTPGSASFGMQVWPHTDDPVLTRNVTYHNFGSTDVSLAVRVATFSPDGTPTPAGMFTVDKPSVVVPAGGDATVAVTLDTRVPGPDGYAGGWLTGTAGDLVVRTPVAVNKEVESYDVTLTHLDRTGATPYTFSTHLSKRDSDVFQAYAGGGQGGTVTLRVPKGHYTVTSTVWALVDGAGGKPSVGDPTLLAQPDLDVNQPRTVVLDARLGQPISVTVPRSSAQQVYAELAAYTRRPHGTAGTVILGSSFANIYAARIGPDQPDDNFTSIVAGQWAQADANGGTDDSPYLYSLFFPQRGRMVTGYQRGVVDRELAQVRADFALAHPDTVGVKRVSTSLSDLGLGNFGARLNFHLPFVRTEYYNTDPGVAAAGDFYESSATGEDMTSMEATSDTAYAAGGTYQERWNRGVFAPSFTPPLTTKWNGVTRAGDTVTVSAPMFSDSAGRVGDSVTTSASATLFRDGTKVGGTDGTALTSDVPSGNASYRLELHAERGAPFALSTKTDIAWTFRSGHVDGGTPTALPLWAIRFAPELDRYNAAPANCLVAVPVFVTPQPGAQTGQLVSRTVEASFDDGVTWKPVQLKDGVALVRHPAGSGFVSLRATAADSDGNTVKQTIVHAYRYGQVK
jgi:subtilisin family serine protease